MKKALFITLLLLIASIVANVLLWKRSSAECEERREIYIDTIPYRLPVPVDSIVPRYETVKLPIAYSESSSSDSSSIDSLVAILPAENIDSVEVTIPITQKVYEDSTYRAYVSGFHPVLDSIFVFQRTEAIYIRSPTKSKRWGVGIQIGAGVTPHRVEPYIGIGISYNLFQF